MQVVIGLHGVFTADYILRVTANEPFDNNFFFHSDWACADGLIYLTEGVVYAAPMNLFHVLLVSIKHTLSRRLITVWELRF